MNRFLLSPHYPPLFNNHHYFVDIPPSPRTTSFRLTTPPGKLDTPQDNLCQNINRGPMILSNPAPIPCTVIFFFLGYPSCNSLPRTLTPSCTPYLVPFVTFLFASFRFVLFRFAIFFIYLSGLCFSFVCVRRGGEVGCGRGEARGRDLLELVVSFLGRCVCG